MLFKVIIDDKEYEPNDFGFAICDEENKFYVCNSITKDEFEKQDSFSECFALLRAKIDIMEKVVEKRLEECSSGSGEPKCSTIIV